MSFYINRLLLPTLKIYYEEIFVSSYITRIFWSSNGAGG
jgi:hypothetical protein